MYRQDRIREPEVRKVSTIVKREMIFDNIKVESRDKREAIRIISHLCSRHNAAYELRLIDAFRKRELLDSTGFGGGIAMPHARIRGLCDPVFAVVRFAWPVEWEAIDGEPVDLAVVAITPAEPEKNKHLPTLAMLARKLMNDEFVYNLKHCTDKNQLYDYMLREMR